MKSSDLISIVIPVYNEAPNIDELVARCVKACRSTNLPFEIVLVNDGSVDGSENKIAAACKQNPGEVIGVMLNRNYGQHSAVLAGLEISEGSIVVTLDADLQNPPEEIPRLVEGIQKGYDVVGSIRVNRRDPFFRKIASALVNKVVRHYTGQVMTDYGCMLRAYHRRIVDAILACREHSTFIPVLANSFAGTAMEIDVKHDERVKGKSKYDLWKLVNLQFDLLTSISTLPLRLLSVFGMVISFAGVGFGLFLAVMRLIYGAEWAAQGVFTLFAILFIFVGVQFIGMGLLGEYIGRIYHDVRMRPRYYIRHVIGKDESEQGSET
jgi:undecaprenyl-phosphate 4-deoxy-4-formamido-L-arabinose transferase